MKRLLSVIYLTAATALTAGSVDHSHHQHHGPKKSEQSELGAYAAFDGNGVLWSVHKVDGYLVVSRSADQGGTWSEPVRISAEPEPTDPGSDARPKIASGPSGEVYVCWTRPLSKPFTGEIRFTRSVDEGKTFSPSIVVHRDAQEITHRFDCIAVTPDGKIFVAWIDKRDLVAAAAKSGSYRGAAIYYAVSHDSGKTFLGDYKVADHTCECCRLAMAPIADGRVAIMWRHNFEVNIRDHAVAELSSDGSVSPLRRATFEQWKIDGCPHQGPSLAESRGGSLHAVWFSGAPGKRGVFYGQLGSSGPTKLRRIGNDSAAHADISAVGETLYVVWKEHDGTAMRLCSMISNDQGTTWTEKVLDSTDGASGHPVLVPSKTGAYVLWNKRTEPLKVVSLK
jgi:hypothetical protein